MPNSNNNYNYSFDEQVWWLSPQVAATKESKRAVTSTRGYIVVNTPTKTKNQNHSLGSTSLADVEVMIHAEVQCIGILVQNPAVEHLVETGYDR